MVAVLNAIAALLAAVLIPTAILVIALVYRRQITNVLPRLRRGKLLGQEIEFESQAQDIKTIEAILDDRLAKLQSAIPSVNGLTITSQHSAENYSQSTSDVEQSAGNTFNLASSLDRIIAQASTSPMLSLLIIRQELGRAATELLRVAGDPSAQIPATAHLAVRQLHRLGGAYAYVADLLIEYLNNMDQVLMPMSSNMNQDIKSALQLKSVDMGVQCIQVTYAFVNTIRLGGPMAHLMTLDVETIKAIVHEQDQ